MVELKTLTFSHRWCLHNTVEKDRLDQDRWWIEQEWQSYPCLSQDYPVRVVIQPTPSFATTITIVSHSLDTFARCVGGIGHAVVLLEMFRLEEVVGGTKEVRNIAEDQSLQPKGGLNV